MAAEQAADKAKQYELSLIEAESRLQSILSSMADLVFILDNEGRFVSYHGKSQELYVNPEHFIGKKYTDLMPPYFSELAAAAIEKNRAGETAEFDYSLEVHSGLEYYSTRISPIFINGKYTGSVSVARNITDRKKSEEALLASEEKYRQLVENINDVIYTLDTEGNITYVSPVMEKFSMYKVGDLVGKPFTPMVHPDDLPGLLGSLDRLMTGHLEPWEFRVLDKDGRAIWVRSSSNPIYEGDRIVGVTAVITDISGRRKAEDALRESEERMKLTLEAVNDGVWDWNITSGEAVFSPNYYTMLGYEPYEFPQNYASWRSLVHSDDIADAEKKINASISSGIGYAIELRMRSKAGEWRWILTRGMVVERDADGKPVRMLGTHSDITKRKQAEKDVDRQRMEYRTILDSVPNIITYVDRSGRFMRINKAGADALGVTPKEVVGKTFSDFFPTDQAAIIIARSRAVMDSKIPIYSSLYEAILPSKEHIWTNTDIMPYLDENGDAVGSINVVTDITGRKVAEQALRESEERFRNMTNLLPQTIFETDKNGTFTFVNYQGYQIFGYTEEDIAVGMNVLQTIVPEDHARAMESIARRISGEEFPPNEYTAVRKDGSIFPAVIYASPIIKDSNYAGMRGMLIDISERKQMEKKLEDSIIVLSKTLNDAVITMGKIVEMKDPYTAGHQLQVARLATAIAELMNLPSEQVENIKTTAAIHDIGKIYVPSDILAKPGKLNHMEISIIRTHPQGSYDILKNIDFPGPIAAIALQHHERLDGSGYPNKLKGSDISLAARILAVADVVEAMSSHRPYRPSLGIDAALDEIIANKGLLYDADAVDACVKLIREKGFNPED